MLKQQIMIAALTLSMVGAGGYTALAADKTMEVQSAAEQAKTERKADKLAAENARDGTADKKKAEPTKAQVEQAAKKQEKTDKAMVDAANNINEVEIDPKTFEVKKKGFTVGDLNPIKWVFKPVIDMQKQVVHLEKQIMRLEAPIASLQKPMVGLRKDMTQVQEQMGSLREDIGGVHGQMGSVDQRLSRVESQLNKMYGPIVSLKDPVVELKKPVVGVNSELMTLKKDLKELKEVVSVTSTLILVAVVAVGLLIVVGTPIAAMFAWRHRRTIMEKLGEDTSQKKEPMDETPKERRDAAVSSRR
jgi:chromosome segregation ATPase